MWRLPGKCLLHVVYRSAHVSSVSVSLVGEDGQLLYDSLVHVPSDTIIDYQTPKSGIREGDLEDGTNAYLAVLDQQGPISPIVFSAVI